MTTTDQNDSSMSTPGAALDYTIEQTKRLLKVQQDLQEKMKELESSFEEGEAANNSLQAEFDSLNSRIKRAGFLLSGAMDSASRGDDNDDVKAGVEGAQQCLDNCKERFNGLSKRLELVEEQIDDHERRLDVLEQAILNEEANSYQTNPRKWGLAAWMGAMIGFIIAIAIVGLLQPEQASADWSILSWIFWLSIVGIGFFSGGWLGSIIAERLTPSDDSQAGV